MREKWILLGLILACLPGLAAAEPVRDLSYAYYARETQLGRDNDIARLSYGLTWSEDTRGTRLELSLGVRNEADFSGPFPLDLQAELTRFQRFERGLSGFGARIGFVEDREATLEIGYGAELHAGSWTLRGAGGAQAISGAGAFGNGSQASLFLIAESTYYVTDDIAVRAGAMLDDGDALGLVGVEYGLRRWPVSFYLDWVLAATSYRGNDGYNDLIGGVRWSFSKGRMKARDRAQPARLLRRYVDLQ